MYSKKGINHLYKMKLKSLLHENPRSKYKFAPKNAFY